MFAKVGILFLVCGLAASFSYKGYKVYDVQPKTAEESNFLYELSQLPGHDGLHLPRVLDRSAQIMVAPEQQSDFESILAERGLEYKVVVEDVATKLKEDGIEKQSFRPRGSRISFSQYLRFSEINNYLDELGRNYPNYVKVEDVGKSYEGRTIKTIRITNGDGNPNKKVIFVDATIHAREWIAPAAALYIIQQLVENRAANAKLLSKYDWLIMPVVNPDGYEYSHTNTRMWRKTRSIGLLCHGTDGNRNFDFHWGEVGTSASSCSDLYRGPTPFSEPETKLLRDIMLSLKGKGVFYLTLHSHGRYILYPWGWTSDLPPTNDILYEVSMAGNDAMEAATGNKYAVGTSTNVLYAAAGGSDDYAYQFADFKISITLELPGGGYGFDPPPSLIVPFVEETWIGVEAMVLKIDEKNL